jgi:hypothetical protein
MHRAYIMTLVVKNLLSAYNRITARQVTITDILCLERGGDCTKYLAT